MSQSTSNSKQATSLFFRSRAFKSSAKIILVISALLLVSLAAGLSLSPFVLANSLAERETLPVIHRVGIVPSTWQGSDTYGIENFKDNATRISVELISESKRFHVLNQDLVEDLWDTPQGRRELTKDFELDGFVHLVVNPKDDHIVLTARLLDENLGINLQETETLSRSDMVSRSFEELKTSVRPLIYRLLTRLPVDVSITSVQGGFVTISGGEDQAVSVGDKLDVVRATVKSIHPAHKGWNEFTKIKVGEATVIETKQNVSVAKVTSQIKEGAIKIGDGAMIEGLSTRRLFAKSAEIEEFKRADTSSILIPPSYVRPEQQVSQSGGFPSETILKTNNGANSGTAPSTAGNVAPAVNTPLAPSKDAPDKLTASELTEDDATLVEVEKDEAPGQPVSAVPVAPTFGTGDYGADYGSSSILFGSLGLKNIAEGMDVGLKYRGWTFNGPVETSSSFSFLPVNEVSVLMKRSLNSNMKYDFGGLAGYGSTDTDSSFFSYGAMGSAYWTDLFPVKLPVIQSYRAGVKAKFHGLSVSEGRYGGHDLVNIGFFGGIGGEQRVLGTRIGLTSDFTFIPITLGRVGYDASQKSARSTNGWELAAGAMVKKGRGEISWGGGFAYGSQLISNDSSEETEESYLTLEATGSWKF